MEEIYLNDDIYGFDNDASASSFGWDFQANAGIFLFLKLFTDAKDIKIESKQQDIEITLNDNSKVFAQAKSTQDYTSCKDGREKLKDAIISLSRNNYKNNKLVYISNIPNTFPKCNDCFNNVIVSYKDSLDGVKKSMDNILKSVLRKLNDNLKKESDTTKINKIRSTIDKIENFNTDYLYFSTICPYYGPNDVRYMKIKEIIHEFLINKVQLSNEDTNNISEKLLIFWQDYFQFNSTTKDGDINKSISKEKFAWPIVVYLVDRDVPEVESCLSFTPDNSLREEIKRYLNDIHCVYHERYRFTNTVLQDYNNYKNQNVNNTPKNIELDFVKKCGSKYYSEFGEIDDYDKELKEYVTKTFIYRILLNNRKVSSVFKTVGIKI